MTFTFPDTRTTINAMRDAIGRDITFYRQYRVPCSACALDPITDTSINSFCIVCSGVGYITTYSGFIVNAHITHEPGELMVWSTGGKMYEGDCRVQVEYSVGNMVIVDNANYVSVDGKDYEIKKKTLRGVKELNRVLIDLVERT